MVDQPKRVGHYRAYGPKRSPGADRLNLIDWCADVCERFESNGYAVTLRQLHYQGVKDNVFENTPRNYNILGDALSMGRRMGRVSWTAVEDRVRGLQGLPTAESPERSLRALAKGFRTDKWRLQPFRPEIWSEKDAQMGVIGRVCDELEIDYFSCHGYNSDSEAWRAGQRFARYYAKGQKPIVFYVGDHDPSGVHMTEDVRDRLEMFCGCPVQVVRLGLNMPQVEELHLPPNYAKPNDSRTPAYAGRFGSDLCWEMDAMEPTYLHTLVRNAVLKLRDPALWDEALREEAEHRDTLDLLIENSPFGRGGDDA